MAGKKSARRTREQVKQIGRLLTEAQAVNDKAVKLLRAMGWPGRAIEAVRKANKNFQDTIARELER